MRANVLGLRALNRALLERQMLLRRKKRSVEDALEHLIGLQAQAPNPPYVGLWTRLQGFRPERLARRITDRSAVRIALMRSTIHLVTARDCVALRPLMQPVLERGLTGRVGRELEGIDRKELADIGRRLVEEEPRTGRELGAALLERWPGRDPGALTNAVRALVPLVQVPPRGVWGAGGRPVVTSMEAWLGRPARARQSVEELILRYLRAFGPATVADIQTWSGLTRLREVTDELGSQLRSIEDEAGNRLLDVPRAPLPDPDTPAPVRFLPEFDNVLLSHADRRRVLTDEHRRFVATRNGMVPGALLVDGFFAGTWKITRRGQASATLVVEPYGRPLTKEDAAEATEEGLRLLAFAAPDREHEVRLTPPR
jgi:hypothetical protein